MVPPPTHCPRPWVLVGPIACSCGGRHITWRCECDAANQLIAIRRESDSAKQGRVIAFKNRLDRSRIPECLATSGRDSVAHKTVSNRLVCTAASSFADNPTGQLDWQRRRSTKAFTSGALGGQRIPSPLTDQSPFVLRAGDDDVRRHLAGRRTGIDI